MFSRSIPWMKAPILGALLLLGGAGTLEAQNHSGAIGVQGTFSNVFDRVNDDYAAGPGINFFGLYHLSRTFDVRADFGLRFIEGEMTPQYALKPAPDLGSQFGERTGDMRVMPFTVDLLYRFEDWSKERFWIPFAAVGLGLYDMELKYFPSDSVHVASDGSGFAGGDDGFDPDDDDSRKENIFDFGWNAKAGVNLHRTSGLFVNLEAGAHFINTRRRWTPMYDVSIGVGTILPVR